MKYELPVLCSSCEHKKETCTLETLCAQGFLKKCPNTNLPVINKYGGILNPPWEEKVCLDDFTWILFSPHKTETGWRVKWMLSIHGTGSCGESDSDNYVLAFARARRDVLSSTRLTDKQIRYFAELFSRKRSGVLEGWKFARDKEPVEIIAEPDDPYSSPFDDWKYGEIGEQLELFC